MELRVLPLQSGHNSASVRSDTGFNEIFFENFFFGKVIGLGKEEGHYLLYYKGREVEVKSNSPLHLNEKLHLKSSQKNHGVHLEILERSFELANSDEKIETKTSLRSVYQVSEILEPYTQKSEEFGESNFLKILQTFFPELEWKDETPYFEWKFGDSTAEGYFGKKNKQKTFYFQITSQKLGRIISLMTWEKNNMEDLKIQSFFSDEKTYLLAFLKKEKIFQFLKESDVGFQNFIFTFSPPHFIETENTEWVA